MRCRARTAGFTMVELIVVMVIIGALAAIGIPRLVGDKSNEAAVFGDQVVSGLRRAQKIAAGHRRPVCAAVTAKAVTLRVNACDNTGVALNGLADDAYATTDSVLTATATTLFFQPDGRITLDAAGATAARTRIDITGVVDGKATTFRSINVEGTTGYVE